MYDVILEFVENPKFSRESSDDECELHAMDEGRPNCEDMENYDPNSRNGTEPTALLE